MIKNWNQVLEDQDKPVWIADTNEGRVYQYDVPGLLSSWEELCLSGLTITGLAVRFRDHEERIASGKEGYYFIRAALGGPLMTKTFQYYILGYLENNVVKCTKFKLPELIIEEEFDREPDKCGETDNCSLLIRNINVDECQTN